MKPEIHGYSEVKAGCAVCKDSDVSFLRMPTSSGPEPPRDRASRWKGKGATPPGLRASLGSPLPAVIVWVNYQPEGLALGFLTSG